MQALILQLSLLYALLTTSEFSGPAVVLKDALSTVEYAGVSLLPETSISLEFYGHSLQGRLLYAENASMGTFISLKINRPGTLRFEMKLTASNRSHQFIILSAKLNRHYGKWHSANIRISLPKLLTVLYMDGRDAYLARLEDVVPDTAINSFGDFLYIGRLPPHLVSESTKVVHFTAAIETSFVGNIRNIFVNNRGLEPLNAYNGAEITSGLSFCYILRTSKAFNICSSSDCLDSSSGPTCGCSKESQKLGFCQYSK
ncbi:unnamed protein product [Hymenolepis diminuta]|uniref:LAM_G_DOMAIN domain-containing protein n=1 Tax=Hymenolepis diminuta TaxID=6216 RepID=A0A0R3SQX7_HYMDI|nr:unnamed protein product [Hymenolepis diminuta]VUZ38626.1 unnamed protein product [Hymenolepis diminuta]